MLSLSDFGPQDGPHRRMSEEEVSDASRSGVIDESTILG